MRFAPAVLLVAVTASLAGAQETWTLVTADFQSQPVSVLSIDHHAVKVQDTGEPRSVPLDQVLELDHTPAAKAGGPGGPAPFILYLNGGDSVSGAPVAINDDNVVWRHPLLGQLEISEDRVNALVRGGQTVAGLDEGRKADSVRLVNGDVTTGIVQGMTDSSVTIIPANSESPAQIGLDKVTAILLADSDPRAGAGGKWRLWLADGSCLTVPQASLAESNGAPLIVSLGNGKTASVDLSAVTCLEQTSGPVCWLTSLTPLEVIYRPFLEEDFPPRFDHPVDDPAVTIRARFPPFRHGIGVHTYTKLTYAVPAGFGGFRTQFAVEKIPDSDERRADVTVRFLLDGKTARQIPHVRFGTTADPVVLDVGSAKELSLEADYGENFNAQGRFLWLDPAFVRAVPSEAR